ncbi:WbqC family protein [Streptomyces hokutonensis]|uniref:WbqC family protein n=1 Tax=Streptomyces hokutonensis TaxID=1306990 RepID=UPI0033EB5582
MLESSTIPTCQGRSERLADLAVATGSTHYLCGTGGLRYLDHQPFAAHGITVLPFHTPVDTGDRLWQWARRVSSLWALSATGPRGLATRLAPEREVHLVGIPALGDR